jgi:hypothetical protein
MEVVQALNRALDTAEAANDMICIVVDGAQDEGSNAILQRWGIPYVSLFDGTPEESLVEIAPLLLPVRQIEAAKRQKVFQWAQEFAVRAPAISWVTSRFDLSQLADHLRRFHIVALTEGQRMLLRWYDTRILPIWLDCLTPVQRAAFVAGTTSWEIVDRTGKVDFLLNDTAPPEQPAQPRFGQHQITLDDSQYAMLVDAARLDLLLRQLRRVIPDELRKISNNELITFVDRYLSSALAAGLDDLERQTQYVLFALYTSGKGLEDEEFQRFILRAHTSSDAFYEQIQKLTDRVCQVGKPLWEATKTIASKTDW